MPGESAISFIQNLRLVSCITCGMTHAVPSPMYLAAAGEGRPLCCPAGHSWTPLHPASDPAANPVQTIIELGAALADTSAQLAAAKLQIAALTPSQGGPLTAEEISRRARLVASRAQPRAYQQRECRFCGKPKRAGRALIDHIRRQHSAELAALNVAAMEREETTEGGILQ